MSVYNLKVNQLEKERDLWQTHYSNLLELRHKDLAEIDQLTQQVAALKAQLRKAQAPRPRRKKPS